MTTLTTSNARNILKQWREQDLDIYLEPLLDKNDQRGSYLIRFIPGYEGSRYNDDALMLYMTPAKDRTPKRLRNRIAITNLAERYQIEPTKILWKH